MITNLYINSLKFYCILFFLFSVLQAEDKGMTEEVIVGGMEEGMIVNSGEAQYDGKEIILVGEVVVQHDLGQICSHRLSILPAITKEKRNKFAFLKICEDVHIKLKDGGELSCQEAEVDYAKMQGVFLGSEDKPDVIYLNKGEKEGNTQKARPLLELKSLRMIFQLMREPISSSSSKILVQKIQAEQHVRVHYNEEYLLLADHALYERISIPDEKSSIAGLLTLTVKGNLPACTLTNLNGDRLSADVIQMNTIEKKLLLIHPVGFLYMRRETDPAQVLEISAQELIWDDQEHTLLLKDCVNITQNQVLNIQTTHEVLIAQAIIEGKKTVRWIRSPTDTQISYSGIQYGKGSKINCPGSFTIDNEHQEMRLEGLVDPSRQESERQQVFIEDEQREMYADRVYINYMWNDRKLVPEKLILEGHVRLMNRFEGLQDEPGNFLHYALADRVECYPKKQEIFLMSGDGNRVLFFDKTNNIQMSASSLKLQHDSVSKKDSVQGFGDVRFTFIENELEQIKNRFSIQKELKNARSDKK